MRIEYDRLRIYEKAILLALLIVLTSRLFFNGGMQQLEYYRYLVNQTKYNLVNAEICGEDSYPLRIVFIRGSFGTINELIVRYEIDGTWYTSKIKTYDDYTGNQNVPIAVKKNNPHKIIRCIPYNKYNFKNSVLPIFTYMCITICIFCILNKSILQWRKNIDRKAIRKLDEERVQQEEQKDIQNSRKQKYILSFLESNIEVICNEKLIAELETPIHEDFLWCLQHLAKTEKIKDILLLEIDEKGEYSFVAETIKLREQKLPKEFYVIAKTENYFLCGTVESSRVYSFSNALGVTNTQYASIYDYIIEKIESKC